ncbi:metallophosphoesterase family protein [Rhodococcus daqingensis]|uniref:Metallophosphoesterase family protein n=1 Tax=Rhodococcus daqingensis TaxID=2479363 RepID=A0ABW2S1B9_9NOCA
MLQILGAAAVLPVLGAGRGGVARAGAEPMLALDLEVVTITDTSAIVTWASVSVIRVDDHGRPLPVAADTELRIGPADGLAAPRTAVFDGAPTPFHYAEVHGLEPGRTYRFEAYSNGMRAVPTVVVTGRPGTPESAGRFTTLVAPPGRHLRTIALANDLHYGEELSGIVAAGQPPGYRQEPGLPPYPEVMLAAMLDDLRRDDRGADHLVIAGDLTDEASAADSSELRERLDGWGELGRDYFVSRGNHDRPHRGAAYAGCSVVPGAPDHHDCWGDVFVPRQRIQRHDLGGLRVLALDTTALDASGGVIEPDQMAQVRDTLHADPDRPTLVFGHHPVTVEAGMSNLAGPGFILDQASSCELQDLYVRSPGVFLHHSGHTHRNRRTRPDTAAAVEFLEVGAVKEYPGGYSLLRIHEGGYMVNFYKTRTDLARQWSQRSRGEYFGLMPEYTLGTTSDRNHVVLRDLTGLAAT